MLVRYLPPLLLSLAALVLVHGQLQTGFISIDCGSPENFNFLDIDTGISYASDGAYINTGININISSEYAYPNNPNLPYPLSDLRSFPSGNKNCYTLTPAAANGSLYLLRASFLYGNYDGEDTLPEFDLYLGVNLWSSVKFGNASDVVMTEIIGAAISDTISVCLVNKGDVDSDPEQLPPPPPVRGLIHPHSGPSHSTPAQPSGRAESSRRQGRR